MAKGTATTLREVSRLQSGQGWLTATAQRLRAVGERGDPEARAGFHRAINAWVEIDRAARAAGRLQGCPIGPEGCDPGAPVRCGHCGGPAVGLEVLFGMGYRRD